MYTYEIASARFAKTQKDCKITVKLSIYRKFLHSQNVALIISFKYFLITFVCHICT